MSSEASSVSSGARCSEDERARDAAAPVRGPDVPVGTEQSRDVLRKESLVQMQTDLGREIKSIALVDTHEHLLPEDQWAGDNAKLIEQMKEEGEPGWATSVPTSSRICS